MRCRSRRTRSTPPCRRSRGRSEIEPEEECRPVVVFNSHPWPLRADVEIEYTWMREEGACVVDDAGESVPMQLTRPLTTMSSLRGRLVFPVDVPPLGYRTYRVRKGAVAGRAARGLRHPAREPAPACSSSIRRRAGSRGSSTRRAARIWRRRLRGTPSSSTTRATPGGTASAPTTTRWPSSSASPCGCSRPAPCGRSSASRAATAPRRSARTTSSARTRRTSTCASRSTGASR